MRLVKRIGIVLLTGLVIGACLDSFTIPAANVKSNSLVIEGVITDERKSHQVRISRVREINDQSSYSVGVSGAEVFISADDGEIIQLTESTQGIYSSANDVQGRIGRRYRVHVTLDNEDYTSEPEEMLESSQIQAVRAKYETETIIEETSDVRNNVIVLSIDVGNNEGTADHYKYDWDATYMIETLFHATPDSCPVFRGRERFQPFCYVNEKSENFLNILSIEGFTGNTYTGHYFSFVDPNIRFMHRYSILAKQYSLTERAFNYWSSIKEQKSSATSLFDPPPSRIQGNIVGANEAVLGFFSASSVQYKRQFFSSELVSLSVFENFESCDCRPWQEHCKPPLPPGVLQPPPPPAQLFCCDCSLYPNSTGIKPSFWVD